MVRLWEGCHGAGGLRPVGGQEEGAGEEVPPVPHWAPSPPQDVDSRDRRRRELGQPEPREPHEQPEPSTSWWPVSSAEKKKNVTLVRAGHTWPRQDGVGHVVGQRMAGGGEGRELQGAGWPVNSCDGHRHRGQGDRALHITPVKQLPPPPLPHAHQVFTPEQGTYHSP